MDWIELKALSSVFASTWKQTGKSFLPESVFFIDCFRLRCFHRQPVTHGRLRRFILPGMFLPTPSDPPGQIVTNQKSHKDACSTRSSAAGWITATVCCTVSTTAHWRSCRWFTLQQRVLWRERESSITSHRCCVNFTGFLSVNESRTRRRRSSTSAYMGWRLHIWPTTASLSQVWRADDTFGLLIVDVSLFQEPGLCSAHTTSRSLVLLCETVCQLVFALHPFLCRLLPEDYRHVCLNCRECNWGHFILRCRNGCICYCYCYQRKEVYRPQNGEREREREKENIRFRISGVCPKAETTWTIRTFFITLKQILWTWQPRR